MQRNSTNQSNNIFPFLLMGFGALLVIVVLIWQFSLMQPDVSVRPTPIAATVSVEEVVRTTIEDAKSAYDNKQALFIDVRSVESYNSGHITGASNIPFDEIDRQADRLDTKQWIITYCT